MKILEETPSTSPPVVTVADAMASEGESLTFTVSLTVSGTTATVTATDTAAGTIDDDDRLPVVTIDDSNGSEGEALTFTVTLRSAVQGGLTVTPSFDDGTAAEVADYISNQSELRFDGMIGEQQVIVVQAAEDEVIEGDETFTVSLESSNAPVEVNEEGTETILDDAPQARQAKTKRLLYLLARSLASEAVAAIGERFTANDTRTPQMQLGAFSLTDGWSRGGWPGAEASMAGAGLRPAAWNASESAMLGMGAVGVGGSVGMGGPYGQPGLLSEQPFGRLALLAGSRFILPVGTSAEPG